MFYYSCSSSNQSKIRDVAALIFIALFYSLLRYEYVSIGDEMQNIVSVSLEYLRFITCR